MIMLSEDISISDLDQLRFIRNGLLTESDWTQSVDSPLSDAKKTEWRTYRQQLRDITQGLDQESVFDFSTIPNPPT
jgi:hypothetical protein